MGEIPFLYISLAVSTTVLNIWHVGNGPIAPSDPGTHLFCIPGDSYSEEEKTQTPALIPYVSAVEEPTVVSLPWKGHSATATYDYCQYSGTGKPSQVHLGLAESGTGSG